MVGLLFFAFHTATLLNRCPTIGGTWYGVDMLSESIADNYNSFVWEPALVKTNAISAATEAACLILSVDETVKNPQSEKPEAGMPRGGGRGRGRGRGRR